MKNKIQIFIIIVLILSVLALVLLSTIDFDFLYIVNKKAIHFFYLKIILAFYFSILAFKSKSISFYYFLNLIWLIPVFLLVLSKFFGTYNLEKLDYLFGEKINNFELTQIPEERGWKINKFKVNNDVFYYNQNPSWEAHIHTPSELKKAKISKSWITGKYYIILKK